MVEKLQHQPEHERNNLELDKQALERHQELQELHEQREKQAKQSPERNIEHARHEALEKAQSAEKKVERSKESSPADKRRDRPVSNKKTREASFKRQMTEARSSMSAPRKTFSKVLHVKAIEKSSEAIGNTVARPNAILAGSLFAFIITSVAYFWARYVGYPLSGFETIGAFIIGWIVGIIFDFTRIMITGKN